MWLHPWPNHLDKDCWHKGKPKCYNSGKFGYAKKDCLVNINHNTNFTEEKQVEGTMFYASQASGTNRDVWYIGSGFSNHMTIKKHMFIEMYPYATPIIKMGNGQVVEWNGNEIIVVQTKRGTNHIRDVLLVPDLEHNLFSVGQLM